MTRFRGRRTPFTKVRYLPVGLSLQELIEWIRNLPENTDQQWMNSAKSFEAIDDLKAFGYTAVEPLIHYILSTNDYSNLWIGIRALEGIGDPRAIEPLWELYYKSENHKGVQSKILWALGNLKDQRVFDIAVSWLTDENLSLRQAAIRALGNLGDTRAVEILIPILNSPNDDIRLSTIWALGSLRDKRALAPMSDWIDKEFQIGSLIGAFANIGSSESIHALERILYRAALLEDEGQYTHLRLYALDAIAAIDDPAALPALHRATNHPKPSVRKRARMALKKLSQSAAPNTEQIACVCAILHNASGQVLLQLREDKPGLLYPAHWTIPGGLVEDGESPDEAIRREILEEIELAPELRFWKLHYHGPYEHRGKIVRVEQHVYTGQLDLPADAIILNEGEAIRWFAHEELSSVPIGFGYATLLDEYFVQGNP